MTVASILRALAKDGPAPADVHQPTADWATARRRRRNGAEILRDIVAEKADDPGLYVARPLTPASEAQLDGWMRRVTGLDPAPNPHVTIVHSAVAIPWEDAPGPLTLARGQYSGWEKLGECYALRFRSNALESRWRFARTAGASWDFPSFKPHLSVCSAAQGDQLVWDRVPLPPFDLVLGPEVSGPVEVPVWKALGIDDAMMEALARAVHDSWLSHNPDRTDAHHVDYADLDEAAKQVDRDCVAAVIETLARLNRTIVAFGPRPGRA